MERRLTIAAMCLATAGGCSSGPRGKRPEVGNTASGQQSGTCPEAHFATTAAPPACTAADGCVQIYQVATDCTVTLRNTIEGVTGHIEWPNVRGDLVLYDVVAPADDDPPTALRQMVIASPLTTRAPTAAWKTITFGEPDPGGDLGWGFVSDDQHAYSIGCAEWEADEEEWTCSVVHYLRANGQRVETTPMPRFARKLAAGSIADGVALIEVGEGRNQELSCKSASPVKGAGLLWILPEPLATAPRYGDRYFLHMMSPGARDSPATTFEVAPMKGCSRDEAATGWFSPGPGGLVGHAADVSEGQETRSRIYLRDSPTPLNTPDGKPFETAGDIAWTAP